MAPYIDLKFRRDDCGNPTNPTPADYSWEYARALFGLAHGRPLSYGPVIESLQAEIRDTEAAIAHWENASASALENDIAVERRAYAGRQKAFEERMLRRARVQAMVTFYETWQPPDVLSCLKRSALVTLREVLASIDAVDCTPPPFREITAEGYRQSRLWPLRATLVEEQERLRILEQRAEELQAVRQALIEAFGPDPAEHDPQNVG